MLVAIVLVNARLGAQPAGPIAEHGLRAPAFVSIKIEGELTKSDRESLLQLIAPDSFSKLVGAISEGQKALLDVCDEACRATPSVDAAIAGAVRASASVQLDGSGWMYVPTIALPDPSPDPTAVLSDPIDPQWHADAAPHGPREYALLPEDHPLVASTELRDLESPLVIPAAYVTSSSDALLQEFPLGGLHTSIDPPVGELRLIERDLAASGFSDRYFRVNPTIDRAEFNRLFDHFSANETTTVATLPSPLLEAFTFIHPPIDFQLEPSAHPCPTLEDNWPFSVSALAEILKFNRRVIELVGLSHPLRARVLVVDTGLGKTLASTPLFQQILLQNRVELLAAKSVQRSFAGDAACNDADGNGYWADIYGAAPISLLDNAMSEVKCADPLYGNLELLEPLPRKVTSSSPWQKRARSWVGLGQ